MRGISDGLGSAIIPSLIAVSGRDKFRHDVISFRIARATWLQVEVKEKPPVRVKA
jgi:hypothetical protein